MNFSENSPFYYFMASDNFGRSIVIFLFLISILSWFLMLDKYLKVRTAIQNAKKIQSSFSEAESCLVFSGRLQLEDNPLARIYQKAMLQLGSITQSSSDELVLCGQEKLLPRQLSSIETETIRKALEKSVNDELIKYEHNMGLMSTIVSTAPFFGLLGTVYGVMLAFGGMAVKGSADLSAIAPGIAGALLTTVAGLIVAIPSVIGYNLLAGQVRILLNDMDRFSDDVMGNIVMHRAKKGLN